MTKAPFLVQLQDARVIGLIGANLGADIHHCAAALAPSGIHSLELTLTTPDAFAALEHARAKIPTFHFGLGTVLDVDTARLGILSGARFIVTPAPRPDVITLCRRYHVPVISGAFTENDIATAQRAGADAVKVYPGAEFGPAHLRILCKKFPGLPLIAIGGVTHSTIVEFLRAGAFAAFAGDSLISPVALKARDWPAIAARAQEFRAMISAYLAPGL